MHNPLRLVVRKHSVHTRTVGQIKLDKAEPFMINETREACLFQTHVIIGVQIINTNNGVAPYEQALGDMEADEAGSACD
jgi:hypothetical protein